LVLTPRSLSCDLSPPRTVQVQAVLSFGENFRTQRGFKEDEDDDEDIFD